MPSPALFSSSAYKMKQERAHKLYTNNHPILIELEERLLERLEEVRKQFSYALQIGGQTPFNLQRKISIKHLSGALTPNPSKHDLILDFLTLQTLNNIPEHLYALRHILQPDGLYLGLFLGGNTLQELRDVFMQAELEVEGGVRPRVTPMIGINDASQLLQQAGFALPMVDKDTLTITYPNLISLMHDLRAMGLTNSMTQRPKTLKRSTLLLAEKLYRKNYTYAEDKEKIYATFEVIYLTGWGPSSTQPQALKPGSGQVSLKEVLKH